jgi:hypothetical protein
MAMPVGAMVRKFREEFEDVIAAASEGEPAVGERLPVVQGAST